MTGARVIQIMKLYEHKLEHLLKGSFEGNRKLEHALEMCHKLKELAEEKHDSSLFRQLGFVQGVLWCEGIYTLAELKKHNRPVTKNPPEEVLKS